MVSGLKAGPPPSAIAMAKEVCVYAYTVSSHNVVVVYPNLYTYSQYNSMYIY
jgi:hypothetical protein